MLKLTKRKRAILFFVDLIGKVFFLLYTLFIYHPKEKDFTKLNKILVLELWGMGDVVLATPALIALRRKYSEARICLLAKKHAVELLKGSGLVDEVITFDFPWTEFRGKYDFWKYDFESLFRLLIRLQKEEFDLAICARMDFRNNLLMFLSGAKRRIGYNLTGGGYFLTDIVSVDYVKPHRVDEWLNLIGSLGINTDGIKPALWVSDEEEEKADLFLKENGVNDGDLLVGIHPGANRKNRCWALHKFSEVGDYLMEKYGAKILIFTEPTGYGANIAMKSKFVSIRCDIRQLMALIKKSDLFICNDSGPMHIATAVSTPVVAVWGPQMLEWIGPYGDNNKNNKVVAKNDFPCRPCYDYCKFNEPYCLTSISVKEVIQAIEEKIDEISKGD